MRYVPAIAMTAALALSASAALAASKKHPRYHGHSRGVAVQYSPGWGYAPGPMVGGRGRRCLQDEGYGRYTICGQGR